MYEEKLTGYLIDVENGTSGPVKVNRNLEDYYKLLNCDLITITYRDIAGKEYCIIADDEGLLKPNRVSAIDSAFNPQLVGSLLITASDYDSEEFVSITDDDIKAIRSRVCSNFSPDDKSYPLLMID